MDNNYLSYSSMEDNDAFNCFSRPIYSNVISVDDFKTPCSSHSTLVNKDNMKKDACDLEDKAKPTEESQKQNLCYLEHIETNRVLENKNVKNASNMYELYALAKKVIQKDLPEAENTYPIVDMNIKPTAKSPRKGTKLKRFNSTEAVMDMQIKPRRKSTNKRKKAKKVKFNIKKCGVARSHRKYFGMFEQDYSSMPEADADEWLTVSEYSSISNGLEREFLLEPEDSINIIAKKECKEVEEIPATTVTNLEESSEEQPSQEQ
ncbi:uncharacterized protein LOC119673262 [Teleopsis dalmanni]|uniref:uncharacterized protein LOC119673262 n=1 Tax=Teleopsis dalmanni TaxID=139649 RepID=UPI0018CE75FF|nr:uncharacterized protein LOC119673262 [Teleopsis dalmanni]XP_037940449.1 uncharacterized protein LOC119673262 [Teleopsis dalmanni]XP_037940451.1 uncharacterized protein LOC119673262 [Teleopsis dalmanni]